MSMLEKLKTSTVNWLDERLKLSVIQKVLSKKTVPQHEHTIWYYFGGMAMFLFILQVITGLLLMVYYQPGIETSYESVKYIMEKIEYGHLIRSIHSWSANLMVGMVFLHMFTAYFMQAYRRPRELTWLTGFGLFGLSLGLGFSGYLLTWDELAYFATKVGIQIMDQSPFIGHIMATLLRGGEEVGNATIGRFFELHIILLPLAMMGLLGAHLLLIQLHGMSTPYSYANKPKRLQKSIPFFGDFLYHDLFIWTLMMGVVVAIAYFIPWELGPKADPMAPAPEGIKPEWYFMFMFQILRMLPAHIGPFEGEVFGIVAFGIAGALWALVPFWSQINKFTSRLATAYGIIAVIVIITATSAGYMVKPGGGPAVASGGMAVAGGDPAHIESVFKQSCASCHSIGGGALVGPDLKDLTKRLEREMAADFIVDPAAFNSAMPKIAGIDKTIALALVDYIEAQSNPQAQAPKAEEAPVKAFTSEDVAIGRHLFQGTAPFVQGGAACISCHSVQEGGNTLGGGSLGPDLSSIYGKLGERKGLTAWLGSIPSPTMSPLYKSHPLAPEEVDALVAYFSSIDPTANQADSAAQAESKEGKSDAAGYSLSQFVVYGLLGMVLLMVAIAVLFSNRFQGVRAPLVHGFKHNKENED